MTKAIPALATEGDYDQALTEVETFFANEPAPGTAGAARFDALAARIEAYESQHWPINASPQR